MDESDDPLDPRVLARGLVESPVAEDFLVVARTRRGSILTQSNQYAPEELETAETEIQLVALFLAHLSDRTGRDREDLLEELVDDLDDVPPRWAWSEEDA